MQVLDSGCPRFKGSQLLEGSHVEFKKKRAKKLILLALR